MSETISLKKALIFFLDEWRYPVITDYHLSVFVFNLYKKKEYKGHPIESVKNTPNNEYLISLIKNYIDDGILYPDKNFSSKSVFNILGKTNSTAEDIVCTVNPFAFVSHLSAMDFHGLTDRNPTILYISTPSPMKWKNFALARMKKDLGDDFDEYVENGFPRLKRIALKKINRRPIYCYSSLHMGAFKQIKNRPLRVATIGRTFFDMLREPSLCGGIEHVLDVYQKHAADYLELIVEEINRHGSSIDKVRAGYILDELNDLRHPLITEWEQYIQRGGSRKLDPSEEYAPIYSKKWCISINTARGRNG